MIRRRDSGFSLKGVLFFVLLVALATFITIHLIRPSYCSERFKTAVDGLASEGFMKADREIREEILSHAEDTGIILEDKDISITWGPNKESLDIRLEYSCPVDLTIYRYDRQFNYSISKKLSYPKKMIDRTEEKVQGSYNKMVEKARNADQKSEYDESP